MAIREREGLSRLAMFIIVVLVTAAVFIAIARARAVNTINYLEQRHVRHQARITELEGWLDTARSRIAELEKQTGTPGENTVTSGWGGVVTITTPRSIDPSRFAGRLLTGSSHSMGLRPLNAVAFDIDKEGRIISPKLAPFPNRATSECIPTITGSANGVAIGGCGGTTRYDFAGDEEKCGSLP
jgi:hypothetical protein